MNVGFALLPVLWDTAGMGVGNGLLSMTPAHLALGYSFWSCVVRLTWASMQWFSWCFPNVNIHLHHWYVLKCRFRFSRSGVGLMILHVYRIARASLIMAGCSTVCQPATVNRWENGTI